MKRGVIKQFLYRTLYDQNIRMSQYQLRLRLCGLFIADKRLISWAGCYKLWVKGLVLYVIWPLYVCMFRKKIFLEFYKGLL